jgi:small subunit ribosomal protein S1
MELMTEKNLENEDLQDDFTWGEIEYSPEEKERLAKLYTSTVTTIAEKQIMKGKIVAFDEKEVVVNIGFKSDGVIPRSEFKDIEDLAIGMEVEVFLQKVEDSNGHLLLSRRLATSMRSWDKILEALDKDEVVEGVIKRRTKGGFVVDLDGIEAFLPGSQIDVKPIKDYDVFVGQRMEFKVVKVNHIHHNVVVSHKVLIEKDLEEQKAEIINKLEKGQILEGTVKNITNYGVFIDLGGVDGLLRVTDISWGRINDPHEVLQDGQKVNVVVLDFDDEKKRISLGMKQLLPHPWETYVENLNVGDKVKGKVVTIADYGIFIELTPGVEGLIHVSEMSWSQHLKNPYELFNIGDEVQAVVLNIDKEERKIALGIKQLTEDPWLKVAEKYAVGTKHTATVKNITAYGLFVELEEGVDGLIHIADLSWNKINHPSEFIKKEEKLDVVVLELDLENRKIRLGHKQLTEDPWDTFETIFTVGKIVNGTIVKFVDKSAILELEYGVEGFCPSKHLQVEEGKPELRVGDSAPFKVIEFNKENRKIILSHYETWREQKEMEKEKEKEEIQKNIKKQKENIKKTTLGEIDVLAELKNKMEKQDKNE